jgi:hypothetical protein
MNWWILFSNIHLGFCMYKWDWIIVLFFCEICTFLGFVSISFTKSWVFWVYRVYHLSIRAKLFGYTFYLLSKYSLLPWKFLFICSHSFYNFCIIIIAIIAAMLFDTYSCQFYLNFPFLPLNIKKHFAMSFTKLSMNTFFLHLPDFFILSLLNFL